MGEEEPEPPLAEVFLVAHVSASLEEHRTRSQPTPPRLHQLPPSPVDACWCFLVLSAPQRWGLQEAAAEEAAAGVGQPPSPSHTTNSFVAGSSVGRVRPAAGAVLPWQSPLHPHHRHQGQLRCLQDLTPLWHLWEPAKAETSGLRAGPYRAASFVEGFWATA